MTKRHVIDYYMDGHVTVAFCKVCSAEGEKLLEDCPQKIEKPLDEKIVHKKLKSLLTKRNRLLNKALLK